MSEPQRYANYCEWCEQIGVDPASLIVWREVHRTIGEKTSRAAAW